MTELRIPGLTEFSGGWNRGRGSNEAVRRCVSSWRIARSGKVISDGGGNERGCLNVSDSLLSVACGAGEIPAGTESDPRRETASRIGPE